ncbi:BgTH12-03175 [Blumeria graminis f. sp. triticale]|uniref:BgTH12-03175 n=1 Tax=Blumeria graminis f. sp. triticale TaxID=1689686 RepID=A0A9W4GG58_BLUGR|nr:BgTH12-03175 [Blumeria graminis f. sp. triticale]
MRTLSFSWAPLAALCISFVVLSAANLVPSQKYDCGTEVSFSTIQIERLQKKMLNTYVKIIYPCNGRRYCLSKRIRSAFYLGREYEYYSFFQPSNGVKNIESALKPLGKHAEHKRYRYYLIVQYYPDKQYKIKGVIKRSRRNPHWERVCITSKDSSAAQNLSDRTIEESFS